MSKEITTIEEVREYVQKDYWEQGKSKGVSGYNNTDVDWWWNGRYCQMLNSAIDLRSKYILDLGCAYGEFVAVATLYGARAFGVDISDYAIKAGKQKTPWIQGKIQQGSIHKLPFSKHTFDFLHSQQVFEHLPGHHCYELATETYRITKPGGVLWVALVLDINNEFKNGRNINDPDKSHINVRSKDWWDDRFFSAGWKTDNRTSQLIRNTLVKPDNFSFFDEYNWHTICYRKD